VDFDVTFGDKELDFWVVSCVLALPVIEWYMISCLWVI